MGPRRFLERRRLLLVVVVAFIGALALIIHRGRDRLERASVWHPRPAPVETAAVVRRTVRRTISYLARLEAGTTTEIAPEIQARIEDIYVDETDPVTQGQLLTHPFPDFP